MTNLEIAQKIADKINGQSQEEIDAMMDIACETHSIDQGWLFRAVSNLHMKAGYKLAGANNTQAYTESSPR